MRRFPARRRVRLRLSSLVRFRWTAHSRLAACGGSSLPRQEWGSSNASVLCIGLPQRRSERRRGISVTRFGQRRRRSAVVRRTPVHRGGGLVKARRKPVRGESRCDLLHLADPAPAFRGGRVLRRVRTGLELGKRRSPFLEQFRLDAFRAREGADREQQCARALRPPCERALDGRGTAWRTGEEARLHRCLDEEVGDRGASAPARKSRGSARVGGEPTIPPSTKEAPRAATVLPIRRAVSGAIAFASTNVPVNGGSARATSSAAWGGQTETMTSQPAASASSDPASSSPAAVARSRVSSLRPVETHCTVCPASCSTAPNAAPISPGCRMPTTVMART